jgi:putative acetyltransferase
MYTLGNIHKTDHPELFAVWEASVRATHHFLQEGAVEHLKKIIRENEIFSHVDMLCVRNGNHSIVGFMGTAGDMLEMLFIRPSSMKKGIGKMLMLHAIHTLRISKVDVNEQNEQAVQFYKHFGFTTVSRSELDGFGNPYPILHMELQYSPT